MIKKSYELHKVNLSKYDICLLYGKNEGLQNEIIDKYFINNFEGQISKYEENEFIKNFNIILGELLNESLFGESKILIISRISEKIVSFVNKILERKLHKVKIILKSGILEKKSKLRNLFEKNEYLVTIPFYEDDADRLSSIVIEFLNTNKIKLSRETINLLVDRARGDRKNLKNELDKILNYSFTKKKITHDVVLKLTNLAEDHGVNELADNYLKKDHKRLSKILNENNYSNEDCILIIRTILNKSKKLLSIVKQYNKLKNIDKVISNTRPPIFWKEKENVKKQALTWKIEDLNKKIYELNDVELLLKINSNNSLNILSNFIMSD